jgi:hypothetical protein
MPAIRLPPVLHTVAESCRRHMQPGINVPNFTAVSREMVERGVPPPD